MKHPADGTWVTITADMFGRLKAALRMMGVKQDSYPPPTGCYSTWRLVFKGQPVAVWYASLTGNTVYARIW